VGGGLRDACLVMLAYRHGLRAKEACELEWSQVEFGRSAALHVRRAKKGKPAVHPIRGDELQAASLSTLPICKHETSTPGGGDRSGSRAPS
jgi:integrase